MNDDLLPLARDVAKSMGCEVRQLGFDELLKIIEAVAARKRWCWATPFWVWLYLSFSVWCIFERGWRAIGTVAFTCPFFAFVVRVYGDEHRHSLFWIYRHSGGRGLMVDGRWPRPWAWRRR